MVSGYEFFFKLLKLKELIILIINHCVYINFMHIDKLVYIIILTISKNTVQSCVVIVMTFSRMPCYLNTKFKILPKNTVLIPSIKLEVTGSH